MWRMTASKGRKLVVTMVVSPRPRAQLTRPGASRPRSALIFARSRGWLMVGSPGFRRSRNGGGWPQRRLGRRRCSGPAGAQRPRRSWSARSTAWVNPLRCICCNWSTSTSPTAQIAPVKPRRRRSRKAWLKARPSLKDGKVQEHGGHTAQIGLAGIGIVGQGQRTGCFGRGVQAACGKELEGLGHGNQAAAVGRAVATRTALAAVLKGSAPTRL